MELPCYVPKVKSSQSRFCRNKDLYSSCNSLDLACPAVTTALKSYDPAWCCSEAIEASRNVAREGVTLLVKCLPKKPEDLSSDSQHQQEKQGMVASNPSTVGVETGGSLQQTGQLI